MNPNPKYRTVPEAESGAISALRLPLAILVVFIHTPYFDSVSSLIISRNLAAVAVPGFFMISAYLLFAKDREWNWRIYKGKLKSRLSSLLLPYVFWNIVALIVRFARQLVREYVFHKQANTKLVVNYDLNDWLDAFGLLPAATDWPRPGMWGLGLPMDFPLWYMRDLMLVVLISPLLSWIINRGKHWLVPFLIAGFVFPESIWPMNAHLKYLWIFILGGYIGRYQTAFLSVLRKFFPVVLGVWAISFAAAFLWPFLLPVAVLSGICVAVGLASFVRLSRETLERAGGFAFFLYAVHAVIKFPISLLYEKLDFSGELAYWSYAVLLIGIACCAFCILSHCGSVVAMFCFGRRIAHGNVRRDQMCS